MFSKIFWTLGVINVFLFFASFPLLDKLEELLTEEDFTNKEKEAPKIKEFLKSEEKKSLILQNIDFIMTLPFIIQFVFLFFYFVIVELILDIIWGMNIHLLW